MKGKAMNKVARITTVAGMGAIAALAIGAGPAQAAGSSSQDAAKPAATQAAQFRGQVVGFYRSPRACDLAGRIGERFNRWDRHGCGFVRFGVHRGSWALTVVQDRVWHTPGHSFPGHGFPGHNGPSFPGHGGPSFPGHDNHDGPRHDGPGFPGHDNHDGPRHDGHRR
jgi:hypothetical protein